MASININNNNFQGEVMNSNKIVNQARGQAPRTQFLGCFKEV